MEMLKRDFRNIFFYEFKLGRNAAQTARNINIVWGEGSVNIRTVQRWFVQFRSGNSSLVTVWWCAAGLIHYSYLNPGETITTERYCEQINEMHQKLRYKCPALVNRKGPILLHDNARPHVAQRTQQKLNELGFETLPHPPYSPDLSPTDYYFFKHLDKFLQEKRFNNENDAKSAFDAFIDSRNQDFYLTGINKLISRWQKCVNSNGCYFD